jgi:hypothetical protein
MIDIATAKAGVDLLNAMLGIIGDSKKHKKEHFKELYEPTFRKMEEIAHEYHAAISDTLSQLKKSDSPDMESIVDQLIARRAGLVMARNGVLGEISAFIERSFGQHMVVAGGRTMTIKGVKLQLTIERALPDDFDVKEVLRVKKGTEAALTFNFADSVSTYFSDAPYLEDSNTVMSGIIDALDEAAGTYRLEETREYVKEQVAGLEARWIGVTKAFTELQIFCLG